MTATCSASLAACGTSAQDSAPTTAPTAGQTTSTTTTIPSILPASGTIPGADLASATNPSDIITTAQRAVEQWTATQTPCYPSKAEALAARDEFARVAAYLAKARAAARAISNLAAFKEVISVEDSYRAVAAKATFVSCEKSAGTKKGDKTKSTTTTSPAGNTKGLTAGGVAEVELTISGTPRVDSEFTIADTGSPCDGLSANTTFLVNSRDATGRWVITDVVTNADGATNAAITPSRPGLSAIEYLAYCGTADKRHGVITFSVKPTGDTTTTAPAPTTTDPNAPLVVLELPTNETMTPTIGARVNEVAVEPDSVIAYLAASGSEGGVVVARINEGDWVALSASNVAWVPVGRGKAGLDVRVVGAKIAISTSYAVAVPSSTTTRPAAVTTSVATKTLKPSTHGSHRDTTLWVIVVLLGLAVVFVVAGRAAQRRR